MPQGKSQPTIPQSPFGRQLPLHKGAFGYATPTASHRRSRSAARRIAGTSIEAGSRPGTPVLPPQRPSRRRSRSAARRVAGTSNRSRQLTGDLRPPSPGEKSRKGNPLPGFRRKPERIRIIFPGDMCGGKNSSHGAKCGCKAAFGRPCSRTRAQCYAIVSAPFGR